MSAQIGPDIHEISGQKGDAYNQCCTCDSHTARSGQEKEPFIEYPSVSGKVAGMSFQAICVIGTTIHDSTFGRMEAAHSPRMMIRAHTPRTLEVMKRAHIHLSDDMGFPLQMMIRACSPRSDDKGSLPSKAHSPRTLEVMIRAHSPRMMIRAHYHRMMIRAHSPRTLEVMIRAHSPRMMIRAHSPRTLEVMIRAHSPRMMIRAHYHRMMIRAHTPRMMIRAHYHRMMIRAHYHRMMIRAHSPRSDDKGSLSSK
ncbi:hypothetical protein DPMN_005218 [Dreissena polymorpha]|uniref:Uncharacterized protein n=1 Tax=Dreissena polymorpha TaxID=45954 RepID=A0A9D4RWC9_DREPO|nr:hypothetical protein DPMN_005218 [Dreissena polymorpha]